jgi:hypothetical protein
MKVQGNLSQDDKVAVSRYVGKLEPGLVRLECDRTEAAALA